MGDRRLQRRRRRRPPVRELQRRLRRLVDARNGDLALTITLGAAPAGDVFAGIGDFNGDGEADILFENPALGQYMVWTMSTGAAVLNTLTVERARAFTKSWSRSETTRLPIAPISSSRIR